MLNYFEEKKLYEIARGMSDEDDIMIFLQVFLVEKGMYPKFIQSKKPEEIAAIINPSNTVDLISRDKMDEIALMFGDSISCEKCPFKLSQECEGNNLSTCKKCWSDWLTYMMNNLSLQ